MLAAVGSLNGAMYREDDFAGTRKACRAGEHLVGAVDSYRHHGQGEFLGKHEGTAAEAMHTSVESARTFRKHHHRHSVGKTLLGILHGMFYSRGSG